MRGRAVRSGTTRWLWAAVLATAAVTACGTQRECNGPGIPAPAVLLDVAQWTATHQHATVHACVNGHCQAIPGSTSRSTQPLFLPTPTGPDTGRPVTVTVTADEGGKQVLQVSRRVQQVHHTEDGPCGKVGWWRTPMTLTAAGELQMRPG